MIDISTLNKPISFSKDEIADKSKFGAYRGVTGGGTRKHAGIDIYRDRGTPVGAAQGGWVRRASSKDEHKTYGALVIIDHTPKLKPENDPKLRQYQYTLYAHLDSVNTIVGTRVTQGETIGRVGNTGNANGMKPHLHFEVIRSSKKLVWYPTAETGVFRGQHRIDPLGIDYVNWSINELFDMLGTGAFVL